MGAISNGFDVPGSTPYFLLGLARPKWRILPDGAGHLRNPPFKTKGPERDFWLIVEKALRPLFCFACKGSGVRVSSSPPIRKKPDSIGLLLFGEVRAKRSQIGTVEYARRRSLRHARAHWVCNRARRSNGLSPCASDLGDVLGYGVPEPRTPVTGPPLPAVTATPFTVPP